MRWCLVLAASVCLVACKMENPRFGRSAPGTETEASDTAGDDMGTDGGTGGSEDGSSSSSSADGTTTGGEEDSGMDTSEGPPPDCSMFADDPVACDEEIACSVVLVHPQIDLGQDMWCFQPLTPAGCAQTPTCTGMLDYFCNGAQVIEAQPDCLPPGPWTLCQKPADSVPECGG